MGNNITDVFFDLDHTLWDFEKNSALAFETIFNKHNITVNLEAFLALYTPINLKYWELFRKDQITHNDLRYGRLKEVFDGIEQDMDDDIIHFISEEYIHFLPKYNHLIEGSLLILEYLQPKYNLHIITNGFANIQEHKLQNANISTYFKTITNSEMAGVKKPNPVIFEYALKLAQTTKQNSIMIGDCLEADVKGALNYGLDAIFYNQMDVNFDKNIKQVNHLLELKKYL